MPYRKVFVAMDVRYTQDGKIVPMVLHWPDGSAYVIAKVLDMRLGASLKVGGAGTRYRVRILGEENTYERDLYLVDNRWFVEAEA